MTNESIIDTSKPNAGRIYDYLLGGHHNFEIDRQVADQISSLIPSSAKTARLQRWCLQDIAEELTVNRGFDVIVDFASGLPTQDHIHQVVPEGTIVIYSDIDPITVEYAKEILKDVPNVYAFEADAAHPELLLENNEVRTILNGKRNVAFVLWGVSAFLNDANLKHAVQYLHSWSTEKSQFVFQAQAAGMNMDHPVMKQIYDIYTKMGSEFYIRSIDQYKELVSPWQADEQGFVSLVEWHGLDEVETTDEEKEIFSTALIGYGAYLVK